MVLRLRSSESVSERDEGKEEKSRIFTVHQDKHVLRLKHKKTVVLQKNEFLINDLDDAIGEKIMTPNTGLVLHHLV